MDISLNKEKVLTGFVSTRWMPYGFVILLCLGLESLLLGLGWVDLSIPYMYYYDFLYFSAVVKGVLEHGWYLNNPSLGAPGALAAYDYTGAPNIDFLIIKFIGLFTSDWGKVINLYYIVTFPLAAVSSLFVFRHFKISLPIAITGSLLFAFAPYHFLRLIHVTYTNYFIVPLLVLVLIWILNEKKLIVFRNDSGRWKFNISSGPALGCIVIALLISASGVYYAFFSCFFLVLAGGMVYLNKRNTAGLFTSWVMIGVICAGLLLQMVPSWVFKMKHGQNPLSTRFAPTETESYALKIVQMLLPAQEHRVSSWAQLREWYDSTAPLNNENRYSSLGLAGSVGFLILLIWLFRRKGNDPQEDLEWSLARLNIGAVLLATVGGFSTLFAYLVTPQIRAYNRISIFIEFFAIFALILLLDHIYKKLLKVRTSRLLGYALCGVILVFGLLDQIPASFKPPYQDIRKQYVEDSDYFTRIEQSLPNGEMVFQLPYVAFPISQPLNKMEPYEHIRGYLHTRKLKWSYGALNGRPTQIWQQTISQLPVKEFVDIVTISGFKGILLNRRGYVDFGVEITKQLSEILDTQPLVSTRGWKVFYSLEAYSQKLKERISEDRWKSLQQAVSTNPFSYVRENLFNSLQIVNGEAGIVEEVIPRSGGPRQSILVTGWALAPDTRMPVKKLMVVHEGKTSQIFISQQEPRMDTVRKFGNHALRSQWNFVLDTRAWGPGEHTFEIYAMLEGDRLGRLGGCEKKCRINLSSE